MKKKILAVLTFSILILTSCNTTKPDATSTLVDNSTTTNAVVDDRSGEPLNNDSFSDGSETTSSNSDSNVNDDGNVAPDDGKEWSKPELF